MSDMHTSGDAKTIDTIRTVVGDRGILTDAQSCAGYLTDWTGEFTGEALAIVRPSSTQEVAEVVKICGAAGIAITTQGGNTGIAGGGVPYGNRPHILLSLDRMRTIRKVDTEARMATVDAGVVLQTLQENVAEHDLIYPLMFGARGSCTIGGNLATNAGGSNVVRYGNARALCIGIEAVLPDGSIVSDISGVRKDNTGYDLRDLMIGSEGTLGIITGASVRLFPTPVAMATAFLSLRDISSALAVLNRLQDASGGLVEAYEYMPAALVAKLCEHTGARPPLAVSAETGILLEVASSRPSDAEPNETGTPRLQAMIMGVLESLMEEGLILDAMIATSGQQRNDLWTLRESVGETVFSQENGYMFDIALPLARVPEFIEKTDADAHVADFGLLTVGHLGDGNLHYTIVPGDDVTWDEQTVESFKRKTLNRVSEMEGSFSAEHGIGRSKLSFMTEYRTKAMLSAMRRIKDAIDPEDLMNPGKTIPKL